MGSTGQGLAEPAVGEPVVGAGSDRGSHGLDAQLCPDSTDTAAISGSDGKPMAFGSRVLRRQRLEYDTSRRPGALGHLRLPTTTALGRLTGGGFLAVGDVGRTSSRGTGTVGSGRRISVGGQGQSILFAVHPRRFHRTAAPRPGGGDPPGTHRRHRRPSAGLAELVTQQARRYRTTEVARDAHPTGIGEPRPARTLGSVRLVAVQLDCRRRLPGLCGLRRGRASLAGGTDRGLCGRPRDGRDPTDAGWVAGRGGDPGSRPGLQWNGAGGRDLGNADLPSGQLDLHLRDRVGGVLLHVPDRGRTGSRRRDG